MNYNEMARAVFGGTHAKKLDKKFGVKCLISKTPILLADFKQGVLQKRGKVSQKPRNARKEIGLATGRQSKCSFTTEKQNANRPLANILGTTPEKTIGSAKIEFYLPD
jgi:hypothetical protein